MGKPITTKSGGICFAFPNVCATTFPPPVGTIPIPYPSIGQLTDATGNASSVLAGGNEVVTKDSEIPGTSGDEPADAGTNGGKVAFVSYSGTVKAEGAEVVRLLDQTTQNNGNASGTVLGGFPTVLVGD